MTEKLGVLLVDVPEPRNNRCLTEALDSIKGLYEENRIEDKEKAEQLIDSYKYAIELLKKAEVEFE